MASSTQTVLTDDAGAIPSRGTFPANANTLYPKGTIVTVDSDGRAVSPATADTSGLPAMGVANHTYDNRTVNLAGNGGLDDSIDVEVTYGVFGFAYTGTTPKPGDRVFVVDNQTVSVDPTGPRGFAGFVSELRDGLCWVWMGPHVVATADEIDLSAAEARLDDLEADALVGFVPVTIGASPAWVDNTTNGLDPATGAFGFNPTIDNQPFRAAVQLPEDLDDAEDVIVRAHASISSIATDDDVVTVLVAKFNGGADVAPVSAVILSVAKQEITFTIPAASVPAGAKSLYLEFDCAGTLDTHDGYLWSIGVEYTRVPASA